MLSANQEQIFNDFGFIVLRKIFDQKEISIINSEFNSGLNIAEKSMSRAHIRKQLNWSNLKPEYPFLSALLEDDRFTSIAKQILGDDFIGSYSNSNSFSSKVTEWHPDISVRDYDWKGIKFGFYLENTSGSTGALRLIPGSHKSPFHEQIGKLKFKENIVDDKHEGFTVPDIPAFYAESEPGDVVLFDNHTWHASWGGGDNRKLCSIGYFANPKNKDQENSATKISQELSGVAEKFPLTIISDNWIDGGKDNPERKRWVESLIKYGFIKNN